MRKNAEWKKKQRKKNWNISNVIINSAKSSALNKTKLRDKPRSQIEINQTKRIIFFKQNTELVNANILNCRDCVRGRFIHENYNNVCGIKTYANMIKDSIKIINDIHEILSKLDKILAKKK